MNTELVRVYCSSCGFIKTGNLNESVEAAENHECSGNVELLNKVLDEALESLKSQNGYLDSGEFFQVTGFPREKIGFNVEDFVKFCNLSTDELYIRRNENASNNGVRYYVKNYSLMRNRPEKKRLPEKFHGVFDDLIGTGMSPSNSAACIDYWNRVESSGVGGSVSMESCADRFGVTAAGLSKSKDFVREKLEEQDLM